MSCLINTCSIKDDGERMIDCWLCHELCHLKCSGLSGLVADALTNNKGLHWCCYKCRKIGVSFYRFFQDTKKKFLNIQEEASDLTNRINDYGKLFDDFKSLDNLKSPPQSSPKRRKSSRNATKEKNNNPVPVYVTSGSSIPDSLSIINNIKDPAIPLSCADIAQNQPEFALNNPVPVFNNSQTINNTLRAVPPKKTVFISRLAFDTTTEDVDSFIKSKVGPNVDISTYKFVFSQPRSITSFKVTVTNDLFERILDPNFWPKYTLVREYIYRENPRSANIGRLPQIDLNAPKN